MSKGKANHRMRARIAELETKVNAMEQAMAEYCDQCPSAPEHPCPNTCPLLKYTIISKEKPEQEKAGELPMRAGKQNGKSDPLTRPTAPIPVPETPASHTMKWDAMTPEQQGALLEKDRVKIENTEWKDTPKEDA